MELVIAMKQQWNWAFVDEFCWLKPAMPGFLHYTFRNGFEPVFHFAAEAKNFKFRPDNVKHVSKDVPITQGPGHGEKDWSKIQGEGIEMLQQGLDVGLARPTNVFSFPHYEPARGHPAVFPVEVPEFFIRAYSDEGDYWLDPFVGSGSTVVAAERNKRCALGMDLKPEYIAVCLERLSEIGLQPELVEP
jgi:DNA modification methylase